MSDLADIEVTGREEAAIDTDVLLRGPPGTGKTTQAAKRVVELIEQEEYDLGDVCWVTYRRDLAEETLHDLVEYGLLNEVDLVNPRYGNTRWMGTMHAIGYRLSDLPAPADDDIRREFAEHYGLRYEPDSVRKTLGELLFDTFAWLRGQRLDPTNETYVRRAPPAEELRNRNWRGSVGRAYEEWRELLDEHERCEFADQLETPLEQGLAPTDGVLVLDELHDFNRLMLDTAFAWAEAADVVIAAGDPDQVINRFDGARREHFEEASDALNLTSVLLDESYRVFSTAGAVAERTLVNAHDPPPVERPTTGAVFAYRSPKMSASGGGWNVPSVDAEGSPVWLLDERTGDETMFVARTRHQVQAVCRALDAGGVIYRAQDGFEGWQDSARLHLHNALRKLAGIDTEAIGRHGGQRRLSQVSEKHAPTSVSFDAEELVALFSHAPAALLSQSRSELDDLCNRLEQSGDTWTGTDLDDWVKPTFWEKLTTGGAAVRELNKTGAHGGTRLDDRKRESICRALRRYDAPVVTNTIPASVQTIHAAKGKQAADVVVYDGITQKIRRRMRDDEGTADNEYRTWYVALTRASERLHVVRGAFPRMEQHSLLPDDPCAVAARATESHPVATDGGEKT